MIFKVALRNLFRHGKSSSLILFFMTVTGLVFMTGNSLLVSVNRSLKEGFRDHITADAVILAPSREPVCLFGAAVPSLGEFVTMETLENEGEIESVLQKASGVDGFAPLISGSAVMDFSGHSRGVPLFGVDLATYFSLFPYTTLTEGKADLSGPSALVSRHLANEWLQETGRPLQLGDRIKLTTAGDIGFTIRSVPVTGIYEYPYSNPLIDSLVLLDAVTAGDLVRVLANQVKDSSPEEASDLFDMDLDDLFSGSDEIVSPGEEDILSSLESLLNEPQPQTTQENLNSWHSLLVRFSEDGSYRKQFKALEDELSAFPVQVLDWRQAAGSSAGYAYFMQLFFYGGFALILLAGILAIVNIMLISLFQRTVEIGTIQALGGTSSFIRRLLLYEYLALSLMGGVLSLIFSRVLFSFLNKQGFILGNRILNMVFGGKSLFFPFTPGLAGVTLVLCLLTGWISSLYPVGRTLALEPVDALRGGARE
jgi:putative ABC transport system permease protein